MKKKIVALLLTLVMLVGIIPAVVYAAEEAEAKVVLTVVPDKTVAQRGETISFTVYMSTAEKLASMAFTTVFPEGFTYVEQSGLDEIPEIDPETGDVKIDENGDEIINVIKTVMKKAKSTLGFDDIAWTEWTEMETPVEGRNFFNGFGSKSKVPKGEVALCEFKATVDADAEIGGGYVLELAGLTEFATLPNFDVIDESQVKVISPEIEVIDHVCAENLTEVVGVAATCLEDGVKAHFICEKCSTKYTDATATTVFEGDTVIPAEGHDEGTLVVVNDATCTEKGLSELRCTKCNAKLDEVITDAHGHDDGKWVVVSEGDCVTEGLKQLKCTKCGFVLDEEITEPVGIHSYESVVTAPTATAEGYTTYTCSACGDTYKADVTPKVTGKVVLTVANKNNTILTGIVNSDYSAKVTVPHGVAIDTNAVTVGLTMTDVASLGINGTKSFEKVINTGVDKNINFDNYIPSTFTGATVSGTIDGVAYAYEFVGEDTTEAFTITATPDAGVQPAWHALTSHIATAQKAADDSYAYVPSAAYVQIVNEKLVFENEYKLDNISGASADELRAAVTLYDVDALEDAQIEIYLPAGTVIALSNYEATLEDEAVIRIFGYEDSEDVNTVMSQLRACETTTDIIKTLVAFVGNVATAIDGQDVTLNIDFGHEVVNEDEQSEWVIIADATCTEAGRRVKYCLKCGEIAAEEVIPAIEHTYTAVVTPPTCLEAGYTTYTCNECDDVIVKDYEEALGHAYESEVIDPKCEEEGYTLCTCANCGDTHKTAITAELGHKKGEAVKENVVDATCTAAGSYESVVKCTVCGEVISRETVEVAAKGHDYKAVVTAPTCTAEGFTTYTCAICGDSYVADKVAAKGHSGKWVADTNKVGYFNQYCTVCDEILSTDVITGFEISDEHVKTKYVRKAPAFTLTAEVLPEAKEQLGYKVVWSSSNEKVATVDEDGNVRTIHLGEAIITATLVDADGNVVAKEACTVEVYYTFCQWLIWFFLFGCAWYFVA